MIQLWSPRSRMIADDEFLQQVVALEQRGAAPFHGARLDVIAGISRIILADPIGMAQPQFVALAYWMRRSALTRMKAHWLERHVDPNELPIARGVALHLPPTNVDTIFVYSWVLSFLAGNTNIVRLPSQRSASVEWLIAIIVDALHDAGMGAEHLFCAFDHDNDTLSRISRYCDLRLIWGGDAKVNAVSQFPLRPDGLSIGFPDRSSATMIASAVYLASDDAQRDALASSLFNDVFWFDQMGCGSPRVVFWIDRDGRNGMADLAVRLDRVARRRGYAGEPAVAIAKMVSSYGMLADSYAQHVERYSNALDIVYSNVTADAMKPVKQGGGLLTSVTVGNIVDVAAWVRRDVQTITHHGLSRDDLTRLAETISVRGGYRLVPVGMALAFGETWDGVPLLTHMTRRIVIQL